MTHNNQSHHIITNISVSDSGFKWSLALVLTLLKLPWMGLNVGYKLDSKVLWRQQAQNPRWFRSCGNKSWKFSQSSCLGAFVLRDFLYGPDFTVYTASLNVVLCPSFREGERGSPALNLSGTFHRGNSWVARCWDDVGGQSLLFGVSKRDRQTSSFFWGDLLAKYLSSPLLVRLFPVCPLSGQSCAIFFFLPFSVTWTQPCLSSLSNIVPLHNF